MFVRIQPVLNLFALGYVSYYKFILLFLLFLVKKNIPCVCKKFKLLNFKTVDLFKFISYTAGVGKLQPAGQLRPASMF